MTARIVLVPGPSVSSDRYRVLVNARTLAASYGLKFEACVVVLDTWSYHARAGDIRLYPDPTGAYALPAGVPPEARLP